MRPIVLLLTIIFCSSTFAGTFFSAKLIKNNTYLSIQMVDDNFIPPFEAGELWKIIEGQDQQKFINEKELVLNCEGVTTNTGDTFGRCTMLLPYNQFQKIKEKMVFKATGDVAFKLNRYFIDSAYWSMQGNQVYLSSYNTRNLFFFGINESLIQK